MYLKKVHIKNYGCVENLEINARFDDNGHPLPIILIGENGSGKTLAIANIVDAFVELKRNTFGDSLKEVSNNKYFKIGNQGYIKSGNTFARIYVEMGHKDETLHYYDIMSNNPIEDINSRRVELSEINDVEGFKENGFSRKKEGHLAIKTFNDCLILYFPADRFYVPLWYNDANYKKVSYDFDTDIRSPKTNMIKIDLLSNIKDWLTYIFLEQRTQQVFIPANNEAIPENLRGQYVNVIMHTEMQQLTCRILSIIKGESVNSSNSTNRKNRSVKFVGNKISINDISQLSEGEMALFAMAMSIVKEWDLFHTFVDTNQIEGIVVVDEADLGLHIDYAYRALPQLMKLFPKVQFVLSAHSPFLLAGLYKEYGKGIHVISMPSGLPIEDVNDYCEMEKAEAIIATINGTDKQLEHKRKELETIIKKINSEDGKIFIYTEGPTDAILIRKAYEKLCVNDMPLSILPINNKVNNKGNNALCKMLEVLAANPVNNNIVIGIFDRDVNQEIIDAQGVPIVLKDNRFVHLGNKVYAFILPVPKYWTQEDQISIEHYFSESEIKTCNESGQRLFLGNEFNKAGNHKTQDYNYKNIAQLYQTIKIIEHETNKYVTNKDGEGNYSLSKMRFAESVRDEREGFDKFDFSEFNKIFDVIREIVEDNRGS